MHSVFKLICIALVSFYLEIRCHCLEHEHHIFTFDNDFPDCRQSTRW